MTASIDGYDEFSMFTENASEAGLEWRGPPAVTRAWTDVAPGRRVSGLVWGEGPAELVLLHGGGQNAHTWDTVALALDRPLVAIDLPGHGHSGWPGDRPDLDPTAMAEDVALAVREWAPDARAVVGMSLGGITALAMADAHPELVRRLALIDITPGVDAQKSSDIVAFLAGPESFGTFDEILERTMQFNPHRSEASLRRGVLHNAVQREDGTWTWRHQVGRPTRQTGLHVEPGGFGTLWGAVSRLSVPVTLVRGGRSPVVDAEDVAEFTRRCPQVALVVVDDAGHSIQGDRPVELADVIAGFASQT